MAVSGETNSKAEVVNVELTPPGEGCRNTLETGVGDRPVRAPRFGIVQLQGTGLFWTGKESLGKWNSPLVQHYKGFDMNYELRYGDAFPAAGTVQKIAYAQEAMSNSAVMVHQDLVNYQDHQSSVVADTSYKGCEASSDNFSLANVCSWPALKSNPDSHENNAFKIGTNYFREEDRELRVGGRRQFCVNSVNSTKNHKADSIEQLAPGSVSILISEDFVVASPVRDNLLLSIALKQHSCMAEATHKENSKLVQSTGCGTMAERVFMGTFSTKSPFTKFTLGGDARRVATEPNAGGASVISESLSVEYFSRRFRASNVVTEMEVVYNNTNWKKVDYICDIYGQRVGVSVTRAMAYPDPARFSEEMACNLLYRKLYGLVVARSGVSTRHSFTKAILHVWCETRQSAQLLQQQYASMARKLEVEDDVIMVLTIAEGWHGRPIFYESCCKDADKKRKTGANDPHQHPWWWLTVKS